jgi:hypothetical protein
MRSAVIVACTLLGAGAPAGAQVSIGINLALRNQNYHYQPRETVVRRQNGIRSAIAITDARTREPASVCC